jgi:non-canonical poly(A) RNA polymerase PAPD5/7
MLGDTAIRASYRDVDELSDSDELDMDISDDEESYSNAAERPAKRARTNGINASATTTATAPEVPKWSNPDPYTALPPPETTRKKDVVQLIRKARVEAEAKKPNVSTEAADFISCDFSDDEDTNQVQDGVAAADDRRANAGNRVANAPTGSRTASSTLPPKPPVSTHNHTSQTRQSEKAQTTQTHPSKLAKSGSRAVPIDLTASASLGNRKRTIDDEIKLPHAPLKKVNRMASGGGVVPIWRPEPRDEDPCPWAVIDHSATPNAGTR